jgi:hypothetical protein
MSVIFAATLLNSGQREHTLYQQFASTTKFDWMRLVSKLSGKVIPYPKNKIEADEMTLSSPALSTLPPA